MKKIFDYQSLNTRIEISYQAGKNALERSYNLTIYNKNKEILTYCIIDNLSGNTIKNKYNALERIINTNYQLKDFLTVPEIERELTEINAELSKKYWEYREKYNKKVSENMRKGIYYFN